MALIYIVDDEEVMLKIEEFYLQTDYTVQTFTSGEDMLQRLKDQTPDLILLDIEMPFMDGFKVLDHLRGLHIPVVGVTGRNDTATVLKFISAGGNGYVIKPTTKEILERSVQTALEHQVAEEGKPICLLVDDETESLVLYRIYLSRFFRVTALNSSRAAMEYMKKFPFDIAVLDYNMPLYNGKVVLEYMRKDPELRKIPIIFLTGETDPEVIHMLDKLYPDDIAYKQEGPESLLYRMREVLGENNGIQ